MGGSLTDSCRSAVQAFQNPIPDMKTMAGLSVMYRETRSSWKNT